MSRALSRWTRRALRLPLLSPLLLIVTTATPALGQQYTGRIDAVVEDATGGRLPGATLTIAGPVNQTVISDARGEAHFLNLAVGDYTLTAMLSGFAEFKLPRLEIVAGGAVDLPIELVLAGTTAVVQVIGETPIIDRKKSGTQTNVTFDELQKIPTARDPWAVVQSVPGIVVDRVNVGGSDAGTQSNFSSKGTRSGDATWNVDGMPITDMAALASPFYFDFDAFQEVNVVTGGPDARSATGGVQMNLMLKSGTNAFHGSAKYYIEDPQDFPWMQSNNMSPELAAEIGAPDGRGDRTNMFKDWGGDVGGPLVKDRAWFWASWGDQDIRLNQQFRLQDATGVFYPPAPASMRLVLHVTGRGVVPTGGARRFQLLYAVPAGQAMRLAYHGFEKMETVDLR